MRRIAALVPALLLLVLSADRVFGQTTTRVIVNSIADQGVRLRPRISGDSRFVAFRSDASDLVIGDANGSGDVFVQFFPDRIAHFLG